MNHFVISYQERDFCPGCHSLKNRCKLIGELQTEYYQFGSFRIPSHSGRQKAQVLECEQCGVFFKDLIPDRLSLSRLFESSKEKVWNKFYSYAAEAKLVESLFPRKSIRVMDLGSANGELLRSFEKFSRGLSALDVVKNPQCEKAVTDEYIESGLDEADIKWSGREYDLVTAFDVMEHLGDVRQGLRNIKQFLKPGGLALIETGDAKSWLPRRFGVNNWWYLNRIEHHVAFTLESIFLLAKQEGLEPASAHRKRHKQRAASTNGRTFMRLLQSIMYHLHPKGYIRILSRLTNKTILQPSPALGCDHLFVLLTKCSSNR